MNWKRVLCWIFVIMLAIPYLLWLILVQNNLDTYHRCDYYTKHLNGGIRAFRGKQYNIVLCGFQGRIDPDNVQYDEVRLSVFSMGGELLAERYYELTLESDYTMQVHYGNDYLTYEDRPKSQTQRVAMPPTCLDWLRARLPRLWP